MTGWFPEGFLWGTATSAYQIGVHRPDVRDGDLEVIRQPIDDLAVNSHDPETISVGRPDERSAGRLSAAL